GSVAVSPVGFPQINQRRQVLAFRQPVGPQSIPQRQRVIPQRLHRGVQQNPHCFDQLLDRRVRTLGGLFQISQAGLRITVRLLYSSGGGRQVPDSPLQRGAQHPLGRIQRIP